MSTWPDWNMIGNRERLPVPGLDKALAAAEAVAGVAIFPNFSAEQRAKGLTDFNDLAIQNPEVVSRQLV
jgi:phage/plasmid primase-like uncharacterized protein